MISLLKKIILWLIVISFVIALILFVVVNINPQVEIVYWHNKKLTLGLGLVIVFSFILGFVFSYIISTYFLMISRFKEYRLKKENERAVLLFKKINEAKEETLVGNKEVALRLWDTLSRKKLCKELPFIEKAKIYFHSDDFKNALDILKGSEKFSKSNLELLYLFAKTHEKLGHFTSSLEYFARIFEKKPSLKIAESARDIAIKISQYDDALLYQQYIDDANKVKNSDDSLNIKALKIISDAKENKEVIKEELLKLHKAYPQNEKIALALSDIFLKEGDVKQGVSALTKLALNVKKAYVWRKIAKIWLEQDAPQKAISAVNSAINETTKEEKIKAYFASLEIFINLAMLDDARDAYKNLNEYIKEENISLSNDEQLLLKLVSSILYDNKNFKKLDLFDIIDK